MSIQNTTAETDVADNPTRQLGEVGVVSSYQDEYLPLILLELRRVALMIKAGPLGNDSGKLATFNGGTGLDTSLAANGSLLIGNGTGLSLATLTQGSGVTITNGPGTITISSPTQNIDSWRQGDS